MLPFCTEHFGNPSGSHAVARRAKEAIEDAREAVAQALGCEPGEVVFTGGGTEADNLAITGVLRARGGVALCSAVEHHAVLHTVDAHRGERIGVDADGRIDLDLLSSRLTTLGQDVSVVSVMLANNEVGVIQPLADVVDIVRAKAPSAVVHTDAVQAVPWLDVAAETAGCSLVAVSAHKFGGPKGVGALVVRSGTRVVPIVHGGGQERELRSGTHNVAGIVGMAAALAATTESRATTVESVRALRDQIADRVLAEVDGVHETGRRDQRIAGTCHLRFDGIESESLLVLLDQADVCASAGSACASGALEPSHVLVAMGVDRTSAAGSLRLSLGPTTTPDDVDLAVKAIVDGVAQLRR